VPAATPRPGPDDRWGSGASLIGSLARVEVLTGGCAGLRDSALVAERWVPALAAPRGSAAHGRAHHHRADTGQPSAVVAYGLGMPARKRPTPQDAVTARRILLDGLARDADIFELVSELAPLHPRNNTFPGEVFLHLAADALDWCGASRADPVALEGLRERFLPECAFRARQNKKLQYAVLAAAALQGGTEPDLLDEVAWWQADDFWQYALFAAVAYIRAAAGRAGVPVPQACRNLAQRPNHPAP
jgi:hypothetical protein